MSTLSKDPEYYRQRLTEIAGLQPDDAFIVQKEGNGFVIKGNPDYFERISFIRGTPRDWRSIYKAVVTFGESGLRLDVIINKMTLAIGWLCLLMTCSFLLLKGPDILLLLLLQLGTGLLLYFMKRRYRKRVTDFLNNI